jgi:Tol biopolymer transport system component
VLTVANDHGSYQLWLRPLNDLEPHPVPGTEWAVLPFWSPDSSQIAFFADDKLKRVSASGGPVEVVCDAKGPRGGTWGSTGSIVFAPANSGPLYGVTPDGREPHAVTVLDANRGETSHRFPWFLPDGRHFLYAALPPHHGQFDLFVGSLDGATREFVTSADGAAVYAEPGYVVFPRQNALVAQRFDAQRLKLLGEPITVGEVPSALGALYNASRAVTVSKTGTIAYLSDRLPNTKLEWFDGSGRALGALPVPEGRYNEFVFSPDGRRLSVVRYDSVTESDIWVVDIEGGGAARLTYGPALNVSSTWSPDGSRILFDSDRNGPRDLFVKAVGGGATEEPLYTSNALFKYSRSWSPDGKWVVFDQLDPQTNRDIWILPVEPHGTPRVYLRTPATEGWGQVSPDGQRLAYASTESGRSEIYVDSFPAPRSKVRVTEDGGTYPVWRKDGRELAFMSLDNRSMQVADVADAPDFRTGTPHILFALPSKAVYALPTPDFKRVLVESPVEENKRSNLTLIFNWVNALEKR